MQMINTGNEWDWIDEMKSIQFQKVLDEMIFFKLKEGYIGENEMGRLIFSREKNELATIKVNQEDLKELIIILKTPEDER